MSAAESNVINCKCDRQKKVNTEISECNIKEAKWDADNAEWSTSLIKTVRDLKTDEAQRVLTTIKLLIAIEWCKKLFYKLHLKWHWTAKMSSAAAAESESESDSDSSSWLS